jgi:sulfur carrier protein
MSKTATMTIELNGKKIESSAQTLAELLKQGEYADAVVATAVNGHFIAQAQRADQKLNDGDRVEILAPMQGG